MELTTKERELVSARIERLEKTVAAGEHLLAVLMHSHDELVADLSYLRAELGLTGQPTLGLDAEPPPAVADVSRRSPAAAPVTVGVGRCQACGHTEEAHRYRRAPACSLCECRGYVPSPAEADSSRRSPAEADRAQVREMMPPAPLADRGLDPDEVCVCGHTLKWHWNSERSSESWCGKSDCNCQQFRPRAATAAPAA